MGSPTSSNLSRTQGFSQGLNHLATNPDLAVPKNSSSYLKKLDAVVNLAANDQIGPADKSQRMLA
jgi:hypothetical protein